MKRWNIGYVLRKQLLHVRIMAATRELAVRELFRCKPDASEIVSIREAL